MFAWPQTGEMLPRLRTEVFLPYMIRVTDLCLRLGRVNEAERFGHEAMVLAGADARVYRLMADVNLVKGRTEAARKFLNALADEAGSSGWAKGRLKALDADPQLAGDARLQQLRKRTLAVDDVFPVWQNPDKPEADLDRLLIDQLEQDPANRMAFEYLMGNYLLARNLTSARALMERIGAMAGPAYERQGGRGRVPRGYQEAMAMYVDSTGRQAEAAGLGVEAETLERMAVFKRIMSQSPSREAAKGAAWERFRHSYFFYYVFGPGDYR
jgi:hypothetical protein